MGGSVGQNHWQSRPVSGRNRGSCCSHQLPVYGCAWSVKNMSLGKGLPTVSCQWVGTSVQTLEEGRPEPSS